MDRYVVERHLVPVGEEFEVSEDARIVNVETWNQDTVAVYVVERR